MSENFGQINNGIDQKKPDQKKISQFDKIKSFFKEKFGKKIEKVEQVSEETNEGISGASKGESLDNIQIENPEETKETTTESPIELVENSVQLEEKINNQQNLNQKDEVVDIQKEENIVNESKLESKIEDNSLKLEETFNKIKDIAIEIKGIEGIGRYYKNTNLKISIDSILGYNPNSDIEKHNKKIDKAIQFVHSLDMVLGLDGGTPEDQKKKYRLDIESKDNLSNYIKELEDLKI